MLIIPTSSGQKLSDDLGRELNAKVADKTVKRFPDGELYVRINEEISGHDVAVVGNTSMDADIIEMLLTLNAVREASPDELTVVFPYFGYSRQHRVYNPGEAISSKVFTQSLASSADRMYVVDIHDEETLGYSPVPFENISIIKSIAKHFNSYGIDYVVSPDDGGSVRAEEISRVLGVKTFYLNKVRVDSRTVRMEVPDVELKGKKVLLVDDIISTGGTIMKSASIMREKGATNVYISAVHGIFTNNSAARIKDAADEVAVTDTIQSEYSTISIAEEVAERLRGGL
ncbi:ribose-phosphate pyrophosphokinase [uncultured archaeon]|nr:ribose-phosphate pyrophosphokinase [uncultured archaeon]